MIGRKYLRLLRERWRSRGKVSYAQCGEDLMAAFLLQDLLRISLPAYLDIGAHHPTKLSNTYLLYKKGCRGVCVEPDPNLLEEIKRVRKRDVCLNAGVGLDSKEKADFYLLSTRTLNTFCREEAEMQERTNQARIEKVIQVPLLPIQEIIEKYFDGKPNFISLDTEGMDLAILQSMNFNRCRPEVFCVETLTYPGERKVLEIEDFMVANGYCIYADTYINTLFVEKSAWEKRGLPEPLRTSMRGMAETRAGS